MKKFSLLIAFISGIILTAIVSWKDNTNQIGSRQSPNNNPVLALRKIKLKDGISADVFEKFARRVSHNEFGKLPGVKLYFGKGERGDEPNCYVLFMDFDSKVTRNFYAPVEDDNSKTSPEASKMVNAFFVKYNPEFDKLCEVATPAGKKGYVDYLIFQ
jgi:hypothetical protein